MPKKQIGQQRLLTLLSDFGDRDVYVGIMKGVIAQINPRLTVVDLTHQIPPQDIAAARFCLMNAYAYFPVGTVHLAVGVVLRKLSPGAK
jgi:S-adenosyl-L-methionine hydrolase (adenosine-forming)